MPGPAVHAGNLLTLLLPLSGLSWCAGHFWAAPHSEQQYSDAVLLLPAATMLDACMQATLGRTPREQQVAFKQALTPHTLGKFGWFSMHLELLLLHSASVSSW